MYLIPLSNDVMKDIQEHVVIKDQELTYTGTSPIHKTSKGQVILGQEAKASEDKKLTLHFDRKQLIISKENKELATVSYQAINQESLGIKKASLKLFLAIGSVRIDSPSVSFSSFSPASYQQLII